MFYSYFYPEFYSEIYFKFIILAAKELGLFDQQELVMFVSEDAHYSNMRPGICLGIGMNNVVAIKTDSKGSMCVKDLGKRMEVRFFHQKYEYEVVRGLSFI